MNEIRKINITDLIINVLQKWKKIFCVMLLLASFVGGYSYIKNGQEQINNSTEQDKKNYSEKDQKIFERQEEALAKHQEYYDMYKRYLDESIKMQINPESFYEGTVKCLITGSTQADVLRLRCQYDRVILLLHFMIKLEIS